MTRWENYYQKNYLPRKTQRNVYWRGINRMTLNGSTIKKGSVLNRLILQKFW